MAGIDPNLEWLGHVQPTGLVVAPAVLSRHGLVPEEQLRFDCDAVTEHLSGTETGPALLEPWSFFESILDWRPTQVAGAPGGPPLPDDFFAHLPEADTTLQPSWAVGEPDGGWQLLVRIEASGIEPDERGALEGWEATPHQRFERLLRETGVPAGILLTDGELRLIHAPRGETSGWLIFPLRALGSVGGRPMLSGLKLLLSAFRLHNDATERRLPGLLKASREAQAEVSSRLATQVLGALHELLRGLHAADRARIERLAAQQPAHLYEGLLTVLLRLVFLLYAEDRALIPSRADGPARALYEEGYGVRALHARLLGDAACNPDTMDERRGAWGRLLALFRLVHAGDPSGWIRGRGGKLFDPTAFPFLQGQDELGSPADPAPVTDGCIMRVLDGLLTLEGERLSYRTLDVEQIGSVYEAVMGFTVLTMSGSALAIKAGKNNHTPVFVDLRALGVKRGADRATLLKEEADRGQLPPRVATALAAAKDEAALAEALREIVDERGSPGGRLMAPGTPLLQPTDERRRTGSHYTPRSLTEPIVRHALEPAFTRLGPEARPETVLALKVCDPAMGSGAFLVEACRQLATRLAAAWTRWPEARPAIPPDEDEDLHARRLVAQRCLYGVDKNPLATDLAKLSLWLTTLARDHEFTFLDHAIKSGDSLVGLDTKQIAAMHWDASKPGLPLFRQLVRDRVSEAAAARAEIQDAPDDARRTILEKKNRFVEERIEPVRILGDAVLSAFFSEEKSKSREKRRATIESWVAGSPVKWDELSAAAASLRTGKHPLQPFHWPVEFPEVFTAADQGFDAIIGNPPFLGGAKIWPSFGGCYVAWLKELHLESGGKGVDLVAHFFRRANNLTKTSGAFGLIATNKIGQGDTRSAGLKQIRAAGAHIFRAQRKLEWPGLAAVVVSVIHISKSGPPETTVLDGQEVIGINSMLLPAMEELEPRQLNANRGICFRGCDTYGTGFIFADAENGNAGTIAEMRAILVKDARNADRMFPFIGGREIATDPNHKHHRYAINFADFSLKQAESWPDLLEIIRSKVKPERDKLGGYSVADRRREFWWQYGTYTPALYRAIAGLDVVMATGAAAVMHHMISIIPARQVFSHKVMVFASDKLSFFSIIQSSLHELWSRTLGTTFGSSDALTYNPLLVFRTYPFPIAYDQFTLLQTVGQAYHDYRSARMVARNEGMTKTYNRFHDPHERGTDILRLRELHADMDRAVLCAYGWDDLADSIEPVFLDETNEDDHTYLGRLFWPSTFRDEVLARLLALNAARAEEERRLGLSPRRDVTCERETESADEAA